MAIDAFPLIEVSGTSYEMGRQHGEQAADIVSRYLILIDRISGVSRDTLCRNAMRFLPRLQALSSQLVEEVRGLADGARISFEEAMLCQVRGEAAYAWDAGCTAFALRGEATLDGSLLIGQNQDLPPEFGDVSVLLRIRPSDGRPPALIYTFAGQLGYFGMNQYGVANYANAVFDPEWRPGLAHYPLKRMCLEQRSVRECVELFEKHRVCSAANTVLSDGNGNITSLEVRPQAVAQYSGEHPDAIIHTSHYLTDEFCEVETAPPPDSFARFRRMTALVAERWGRVTMSALQGILADHEGEPAGICRHGTLGMHTTSGHIAEPQKGILHIRRGHGCTGSWQTYGL